MSRLRTAASQASAEHVAFAALALGLSLGSTGPSILRSSESTGILFGAWRMLIGAALYTVVMAVSGKRLTFRILRDGAIGGAFFGLSIGLFYASIAHTSIANAMVISALRPAIVIAIVGPMFHEKVNKPTVVWTAVAIGGAVFAVMSASDGGSSASFKGDALALLAALAGTGYLLATKRGRGTYDSFSFTTAMMVSGTAVLFPLSLSTGEGIAFPPAGDWKYIIAMAVLPGFGHVLNNYSVAHLPLSVVSNAFLLNPGVAATIAWLVIDEKILRTDIIGMAVTIAALGMVIWNAPSNPLDPERTDERDDAT